MSSLLRPFLALALALVLAALPSEGAAAPADTPAATLAPTQLPRGVRPLHYDVALVLHAEAMRFDGRVAVTLDVIEPTTRLTLNALDLRFTTVQLVRVGARQAVAPASIAVDAGTQTATFAFARTITGGRYRLLMSYSGVVGTQPIGLFAIDYDSVSRRGRALYTQFENADARRVIPSWTSRPTRRPSRSRRPCPQRRWR